MLFSEPGIHYLSIYGLSWRHNIGMPLPVAEMVQSSPRGTDVTKHSILPSLTVSNESIRHCRGNHNRAIMTTCCVYDQLIGDVMLSMGE